MTTNQDRAQIEALGESMAMSKREAALQRRIEGLKIEIDRAMSALAPEGSDLPLGVTAEQVVESLRGEVEHLRAREDQQMRFAAGVEREAIEASVVAMWTAAHEASNDPLGSDGYRSVSGWRLDALGDVVAAIRARGHG